MLPGFSLTTPLLASAIALGFVLVVGSLIANRFKPGLSDIPGPALAAYSKLWRLHNVRQGSAHLTAIELHRKYGKLVRIAPNVVSVGDAMEIPKIYNIKGENSSYLHAWQGLTQTYLTACRRLYEDWFLPHSMCFVAKEATNEFVQYA